MSVLIEEVRFTLPHIELAAHLYGPEDGQPVLALHGWLDNAMSFARLAPLLPGLRIVALDLAGHGLSGHRPAGVGYTLWDHALDVLMLADQLGWQQFALLGHSMGASVAMLTAAALPERVTRLALIDGMLPLTHAAEEAPQRLGEALRAQLALAGKRKPCYASIERAVEARLRGGFPLSREAAELLASRGLMPQAGGYTWRSDPRLTLPSPLRLTPVHVEACLRALCCPVSLVLAEQGLVVGEQHWLALLESLPIALHRLPGGHHLHLDDQPGAVAVADCFKPLFAAP